MAAIGETIHGELLTDGFRNLICLSEQCNPLFLRYALTLQRKESEIFPEAVVDDWGHEITSFKLYDWIQARGHLFPRAEVFGFNYQGSAIQCFLREIDIEGNYSCYAYPSIKSNMSRGELIEGVMLPDPMVKDLVQIDTPVDVSWLMRSSRLRWWKVNPKVASQLDFSLLDSSDG